MKQEPDIPLDDLGTSFEDDGIFSVKDRVLIIDGDILIYKPCCIFNEDTEEARRSIIRNIDNTINKMLVASEASKSVVYLTTKYNYRDLIADDYKANRIDKERPVNLSFIKNYMVRTHGAIAIKGLEADDLLVIHQRSDPENTVLWSTDKDLRQSEGLHLDDATMEVIEISHLGELTKIPDKKPTKYYFTGFKGLMFQALVGDTADYIIGCGVRQEVEVKSGKAKGTMKLKRIGSTPSVAYNLLSESDQTAGSFLKVVFDEYQRVFEGEAEAMMDKQLRLLYMIEEFNKDTNRAKMWNYAEASGRSQEELWMDITTGEYYDNDT